MVTISASSEQSLHNASPNHSRCGTDNNVSKSVTNMATISASLEQSLQKCSPNLSRGDAGNDISKSVTLDSLEKPKNANITIELDSHSNPHQWEQFLDLKSGELYYINKRDGKRNKEDPTKTGGSGFHGNNDSDQDSYSDFHDSDSCSSTSSSSSSSRDSYCKVEENILVVAGCKGCLMYRMLPKQVEECPKCGNLLIHFH